MFCRRGRLFSNRLLFFQNVGHVVRGAALQTRTAGSSAANGTKLSTNGTTRSFHYSPKSKTIKPSKHKYPGGRWQVSSGEENQGRETLWFQQATRNAAIQHEQTSPACDRSLTLPKKTKEAYERLGITAGPQTGFIFDGNAVRRTQSALCEEMPALPHTPSLSWLQNELETSSSGLKPDSHWGAAPGLSRDLSVAAGLNREAVKTDGWRGKVSEKLQ